MFDLVFFILFIFMFFIIPFLFIFLTYKIFSNRYRDFAFNETKRKEIIQNLEKESEKFFDTIEISNKDFFSNVKSISEYVHYKYIQLLNKSESLKFYLIKKEEPFVLAKAYLLGAIKTLNIFSWKNLNGAFFIKTSDGIINGTIIEGVANVKYIGKNIGNISYLDKSISVLSKRKRFTFDRKDMYISKGRIGPFYAKHPLTYNYSYNVLDNGKVIAEVRFNRFGKKDRTLLGNLDKKLSNEEKIMIFCLPIIEFLISLK